MKKTAVVVLAAVLVAGAAAQDLWHDESTRPSAGDYAAEAGGALLGGVLVGAGAAAVLGLAGGFALFNPSGASGMEQGGGAIIGALAGAALGYPFGCGLGTTIAGRATYADGNVGGAYAGAYIGLLLPFIGSPIGAVIGYNTGVQRTSSWGSLGARLAPPTLAYSTRQGPERQRYSAFDCRLVTVRF
jgi:hypothetical protein